MPRKSKLTPYPRKFANPRVDVLFKRLFGTEKNKSILMAFLKETLGQEILEVTIENNELQDAAELSGKAVRLDVLAQVQTAKGPQFVNIEIQNLAHVALANRALYYWARVYTGQLKEGME